jgi:hypothetical protein
MHGSLEFKKFKNDQVKEGTRSDPWCDRKSNGRKKGILMTMVNIFQTLL